MFLLKQLGNKCFKCGYGGGRFQWAALRIESKTGFRFDRKAGENARRKYILNNPNDFHIICNNCYGEREAFINSRQYDSTAVRPVDADGKAPIYFDPVMLQEIERWKNSTERCPSCNVVEGAKYESLPACSNPWHDTHRVYLHGPRSNWV